MKQIRANIKHPLFSPTTCVTVYVLSKPDVPSQKHRQKYIKPSNKEPQT